VALRRFLYPAGALVATLALLPLLLAPEVGIAAVMAAALVFVAWQAVVYPLVLIGLVPVLIALLGSNPAPQGMLTLLLAGWIVMAICFAFIRGSALPFSVLRTAPVVLSLGLGALLLARLDASHVTGYGTEKVQLFVTQNLLLLVAGIIVGRTRRHVDLFLALTLVVAVASAVVLIDKFIGGHAEQVLPGRFALSPEQNPIFLGRKSADGLIIAIYLLVGSVAALPYRILALACLPALAIALVAAGSRGPVLGLLLGVAALLALLVRSRASRRRIPLLVISVVLAVVAIGIVVPHEATQRSLSILSDAGSGVSSNGRSQLWSLAFEQFAGHPLEGVGTGGFAVVAPVERYPHNILLEGAAELGVAGLLLLLGVMVSAFSRLLGAWRRAPDDLRPVIAVVLALLVASIANSLLSGDITVNDSVWLFAGLGVGLAGVTVRDEQIDLS
jgi:putative inorganic carbon (HCO3(-)) transporter